MSKFVLAVFVSALSASQVFASTNITASYQSSYARMADGTVKAWGKNGNDGRLGINNNDTYSCVDYPTNVLRLDGSILSNVAAVAGGRQHALALLTDGSVAAWGSNGDGALGVGQAGPYASKYGATNMHNITNAMAIDAGNGFSLLLLSNNLVYGCGNNDYGQMGATITSNYSRVALEIAGLTNIVKIAAGTMHCLALDDNGVLYAWGNGTYGKLGNDQTGDTNIPVAVLSNVVTMAAAVNHSLAVTSDGRVWAWGNGGSGKLGNGNNTNAWIPVLVSDASYEEITVATNITTTYTTNTTGGTTNYAGACKTEITYLQVDKEVCTNYIFYTNTYSLQTHVKAVAAGRDFSLALDTNNRVWAWGTHSKGQLGIGAPDGGNFLTPQAVFNQTGTGYLTNVVEIAAAKHQNGGEVTSVHSMARLADGTVLAWGDNTSGQLAISTNLLSRTNLPTAVQF